MRLLLKSQLIIAFIFSFLTEANGATYYWVSSTAANWSSASSWSLTSGGTGGAGVPSSGDQVIFDGASGMNGPSTVDIAATISTLTVSGYTGTITIASTLTATNCNVTTGAITGGTLNFSGGGTVTINGITVGSSLTGSVLSLALGSAATVFTQPVSLTVTGTVNSSIQLSTFSQSLTITNTGRGQIGPATSTFNGPVIWNNNNIGTFVEGGGDVYNSSFTINNTSTGTVNAAYSGTTIWKSSVSWNNTAGGTIQTGASSGFCRLNSGASLSLSDNGSYNLSRIIWQDTRPVIYNLASVTNFTVYTCTFSPDVNFTVPSFSTSGSGLSNTFNGNFVLTITGSSSSNLYGNTFAANKTASITRSGSGSFIMTSNTFNGTVVINNNGSGSFTEGGSHTYNNGLTFNHNSASTINLCGLSANTLWKGSIKLNNTAGGIIKAASSGNLTMSTGATLSLSDNGTYNLNNLTQQGIATPFTVNFATAILTMNNCVFNSDVSLTVPYFSIAAPNSFLGNFALTVSSTNTGSSVSGCTFATGKTVTLTNNGGNVLTVGSSTYNGPVTWNNNSTGSFTEIGPEVYNSSLTINNNSASTLLVANTGTTNWTSSVILNNTGGGVIKTCVFGGTVTMSTGATLNLGDNGTYNLANITQQGTATPFTVNFATAVLTIDNCIFNSDVSLTLPFMSVAAPNSFLGNFALTVTSNVNTSAVSGCTFPAGKTVTITNTGASSLTIGNTCTFNGAVTWNNNGTGFIIGAGPAVYNSSFTVNALSNVFIANTGATTWNGAVTLNAGNGISIYTSGNGGGVGTCTLAPTASLNLTDNQNSAYRLTRLTVASGSPPLTINLTNANLILTNDTFNSDVNFSSSYVNTQTCVYQGKANLTFTGTGNGASNSLNSSNTFNGATIITNTSPLEFSFGFFTGGDTFNSSVTFNNLGGGILDPVYKATSVFNGDITYNSTNPQVIGTQSTGIVNLTGSVDQKITTTGSPSFTNVSVNKSAGSVILNSILDVIGTLSLTKGIIKSTATNYIIIDNGALASGANNSSYVDGPVVKAGTQPFTFPVGKSGSYRPIAISTPPANPTDSFTAEYFNAPQNFGGSSTFSTPLYTVSACDYWILNRTTGSSAVTVTLSWNSANCTSPYISDLSTLVVSRWNGTNWVSHGNGGTTGDVNNGTVMSSGNVTSFSPFALGSTSVQNPLPIELTNFMVKQKNGSSVLAEWFTETEVKCDRFELEKSPNGFHFTLCQTVKGNGTSNEAHSYFTIDNAPFPGINYYRLKQIDFDGAFTYSEIVSVDFKPQGEYVYPNPTSAVIFFPFSPSQKVVDAHGKTVLESHVPSSTLDLSGVPEGLYFLITQPGVSQKIIIQR